MAQNLTIGIESKRDLVINQVPFTTKPPLQNNDTIMKLLAVTKFKEEPPYKPEEFTSGLIWRIAHTFSHKKS